MSGCFFCEKIGGDCDVISKNAAVQKTVNKQMTESIMYIQTDLFLACSDLQMIGLL